jgi:uncharacterized membrane protein HdeD (DUF308 family)
MNLSFWLLWGFDALIGLVVVYFFLAGLADKSVSSDNAGIWMIMLLVVAGVLGGSYWLQTHEQPGWARMVLWLMAAPGLLAVLFMLVVLLSKPRWN